MKLSDLKLIRERVDAALVTAREKKPHTNRALEDLRVDADELSKELDLSIDEKGLVRGVQERTAKTVAKTALDEAWLVRFSHLLKRLEREAASPQMPPLAADAPAAGLKSSSGVPPMGTPLGQLEAKPRSLKEKLENNIAWVCISVGFSAFMVGLGAYRGVLEIGNLTSVRKDSFLLKEDVKEKYILKTECGGGCPPPIVGETALAGEYASCIARARELKRPYAILAATMRARVEDNRKVRTADLRTTYTLFPLRDIAASETTFKEEYSSGFANASTYFPGSDREISHGSGSRVFDVVFDAKSQQPRSVTTGTIFSYELPLKAARPAFGSSIVLGAGDDYFAYPNDVDVICEATLIVESESIRVTPVGQAAKRVSNRVVSQADATLREGSRAGGLPRTLSTRWMNIVPGEEVGIHYTW